MAKSSRFSISGTISMIDRVTGTMKKASRSVTGFSRKMRSQFKMASFSAKRLNKSINRIGGRAATRGLQGLAIGIALVAREYVRFDDAIFGATARFKAAEKPGTDMKIVMDNLRKAARKTGAETQFTAAQAADGLNKFALAGFNSEEAIGSLRSQVDLATVTGEEFMRVADISTDLLGSFGFATLESSKKVEKLKEMNALLAVGTLSANVTMEDLFDTLKKSAPIGTKAGIAMEDMIAATSVLGSAGLKGGDAATALRNIFTRLVAPTKEVERGFARINLRQKDFITSEGKLKNVTGIFAAMGKEMGKMTPVESAAAFKELFGLRGIAGASVLEKNIVQVREQLIRMGKDPQKVMAETAEFMRQSFGNKLKALGSAATEFGFKIIEAFAGKGKKGIDVLTDSIRSIDPTPIIKILKIIGSVISFLSPLIPLILGVVIAIKAWAVVQAVINFLLTANPIGLVIAAVAALVAGIILLVDNWDAIKKSLGDTIWGQGLLIVLDAIGEAISAIVRQFELLGKLLSGDMAGFQKMFAMSGMAGTMLKAEAREKGVTADQLYDQKLGFASPNSKSITTNNTTTTKGRVDINVAAPAGTTTEKSGTLPEWMRLNKGPES